MTPHASEQDHRIGSRYSLIRIQLPANRPGWMHGPYTRIGMTCDQVEATFPTR